jgi:CPA2 family monovalent cation:H+ antiporter-2
VAVLLFQDLWIVPLMILIPLMGGAGEGDYFKVASIVVGKVCVLIAFIFLGAKYVVPVLLRQIAKTKSRELFLIAITVLSIGAAYFTHKLGLSLALGAFIAGLVISESDYGHQAVADVIPLRDLFVALFFVSVGMLLDFRFVGSHLHIVIAIAAVVMLVKFFTTASLSSLLGFPSRVAAVVAIILAQVGEFSFILAEQARAYNLMTESHYQYFLATTLISMLVAPSLIRFAPRLAPALSAFDFVPFAKKRLKKYMPLPDDLEENSDVKRANSKMNHVVLIGYGLNGRSLTKVLGGQKIPYSIIEMNHDNILRSKAHGEHIIFGDAAREEILRAAGVLKARMVVIAISDPHWISHIVTSIRSLRSDIHILVRNHYYRGVDELERMGVSDIVVGELEGGVEMLTRVLRYYGVKDDSIEGIIKKEHADKNRDLRKYLTKPIESEGFMGWLSSSDILPVLLPEDSPAIGKSLVDLKIKEATGALVVTVYRKAFGYKVPETDFKFEEGDLVYLVGDLSACRKAEKIFLSHRADSLVG